jgi:hypothetical protein
MKLCAPSYLIPGTWLENLEAMRDLEWLDGVELLFFAYDEDARSILARERGGLAELSGRFELSLHLPDPLRPRDEELVALTRDFVRLYVLHPPASGDEGWAALVDGWRGRYGEDFLLEYTGPERFSDAEAVLPGLPLCADTGRLLRDGLSPAAWIAERSGRVREIHLHAAVGAKDHAPLIAGEAWLAELCPLLGDFAGRVELELFSRPGVEHSHSVLAAALAASQSPPAVGRREGLAS